MNKKGFTLIELIMVIAILGILAAYAVPRFIDLTGTAETKAMGQIRVEIDSGIRMVGLDSLAATGEKNYPSQVTMTLADVIDDSDGKLSYTAAADSGTFTYAASSGSKTLKYVKKTNAYFLSTEFK